VFRSGSAELGTSIAKRHKAGTAMALEPAQ